MHRTTKLYPFHNMRTLYRCYSRAPYGSPTCIAAQRLMKQYTEAVHRRIAERQCSIKR